MATWQQIEEALKKVHDQQSFIQCLLKETLEWPIPDEAAHVDDISYEWSLSEIRADGLDEKLVAGKAWQIQKLDGDQPWGVFILEFASDKPFTANRGMTSVLRKILRGLVANRRKQSNHPVWKREHLLFICTHKYKYYQFAYFREPQGDNRQSALATFGWSPDIPARTACTYNLPQLVWPHGSETETAAWTRKWASAFDVEKVTREFFEEFCSVFENFEAELERTIGNEKQRKLFTQRLFNRLLFLRFIEQKGWLEFNGRHDYLRALFAAGGYGKESFYTHRLQYLFFEAMAVKGQQQNDRTGSTKYLNGGLFSRTKEDDLVKDLRDGLFEPIIGETGLFYRYNFTVEESTPLNIDVAVDPEMLGKVFEKLVIRQERKDKGAYYTPRHIVSFMCKETLKGYLGGYEKLVDEHLPEGISIPVASDLLQKLRDVRIVDPACGSGAYLLGMMHELDELNGLLDSRVHEQTPTTKYERRLAIIQNNLYGVDLEEFAANTACLRLWLALAVEYDGDSPQPLPNLDFKIGVGDSLSAPDPLGSKLEFAQAIIRTFAERKVQYSDGRKTAKEKEELQKEILSLRDEIRKWVRLGSKVSGFDWAVEFAEVFLPRVAGSTITGEINLGDQLAAQPVPGGFDIVIANPPYGIKVEDSLRTQYFRRQTGESQSKDSYGIFMARALQLMRSGGQFSFIVSDTWRTIKSHKPLRKRLLDQTSIKHVLDLPAWIFDATVNTCILTLSKTKPTETSVLVAGDLRAIENDDWHTLAANLLAVSKHGPDAQTLTYARYTYPQKLCSIYDNCSVFVASPLLYQLMSDKRFQKLSTLTEVKVGLQTSDNEYYLRKRVGARGSYEILDEEKLLDEKEIKTMTPEEKLNGVNPKDYGGRHFVPYDKGGESDSEEGWLPNFYVPTQYFIDWSKQAVRRLNNATIADVKRAGNRQNEIEPGDDEKRAAVIRNPQYYFKPGITFSPTGVYSPSFRLGSAAIFGNKGSTIFLSGMSVENALALFCSRIARYLWKSYSSHTVETGEEVITQLPIPNIEDGVAKQLNELATEVIAKQQRDATYPYHKHEQREIEAIVAGLYNLSEHDLREIELWYCRRYPRLAEAQGVTTEVKEKYADFLAHAELLLKMPPEYWQSHPVLTLIAQNESATIEFKSSAKWDYNQNKISTIPSNAVVETVASFLNTKGGDLLIGVHDSGAILGLEKDYESVKGRNRDGFARALTDMIFDRLGNDIVSFVDLIPHVLDGKEVWQVRCRPVDKEVYLKDGKNEHLLVRRGPESVVLSTKEAVEYVKIRWPE